MLYARLSSQSSKTVQAIEKMSDLMVYLGFEPADSCVGMVSQARNWKGCFLTGAMYISVPRLAVPIDPKPDAGSWVNFPTPKSA